jgi:decaprenylphospho-beta-D-erythro-pentofuranosid-2-ulose 2-reductase
LNEARKKIVIVGATSAIATECARQWAEREPVDMVLAGRNVQRLQRTAADLQSRSPQSAVRAEAVDFHDPGAIARWADEVVRTGRVDVVLIAHGLLPQQEHCQQDLRAAREALEINGVSPVLFAEAFAGHLGAANHGALVLIGSVAGDRGRKTNYVYGAGKAMMDRYAQGLRHRFAATNVRVVLAKPGPTDTPMTAQMKAGGARLASPRDVAQAIVGAVDRGRAVVYAPAKWWLIMMVIRHLPSFIFNKLNI